ncbi:MAG: hypothetical protein NTZ72_07120 [Afipia sp.]|nr:hypothetical protein [Afipia sp.]
MFARIDEIETGHFSDHEKNMIDAYASRLYDRIRKSNCEFAFLLPRSPLTDITRNNWHVVSFPACRLPSKIEPDRRCWTIFRGDLIDPS